MFNRQYNQYYTSVDYYMYVSNMYDLSFLPWGQKLCFVSYSIKFHKLSRL